MRGPRECSGSAVDLSRWRECLTKTTPEEVLILRENFAGSTGKRGKLFLIVLILDANIFFANNNNFEIMPAFLRKSWSFRGLGKGDLCSVSVDRAMWCAVHENSAKVSCGTCSC